MQAITTSIDRVRAAGFWCEDADSETNNLLVALNKNANDELPLGACLPIIGLGATLIFLGAAHPRYRLYADRVLSRYADALYGELGKLLETDLRRERLLTYTNERDSLRRELRTKWQREKQDGNPSKIMLCQAVLIMLTQHPLHIKVVHAGRAMFSADPTNGLLDTMTAKLDKLLHEPI